MSLFALTKAQSYEKEAGLNPRVDCLTASKLNPCEMLLDAPYVSQ